MFLGIPHGIWVFIALLVFICIGLSFVFFRSKSKTPIKTDEPSTFDRTTKNIEY
jgi:uncharacterized protein YpmB